MKTKITIAVLVVLGISIVLIQVRPVRDVSRSNADFKINGVVYDEVTAIKIAEAVWLPIYGDGIFDRQPSVCFLYFEIADD